MLAGSVPLLDRRVVRRFSHCMRRFIAAVYVLLGRGSLEQVDHRHQPAPIAHFGYETGLILPWTLLYGYVLV